MTQLASAPPTTAPSQSVALIDGAVLIRDLSADGPAFEAAHAAADRGNAPETEVRRMLEIGGSVLLAGPHRDLLDQVDDRVARILGALDERAAGLARLRAVADVGTAKGVAFEALVAPIVERSFAPFGDIVEDTSRTPGVDGRAKHGDFTVTLAADSELPQRRIVVEVKDRPTLRLTGSGGALDALDQAIANRDACAGILVCATASPALASQRLRSYPDGRIIALLDKNDPDPLALEVACVLARSIASRPPSPGPSLSPERLAAAIAQLRTLLDDAAAIRKGVLTARRGLDEILETYERLQREADGVLGELAGGDTDE